MGLGHQPRAVGVAFAAVDHRPAGLGAHDLEPGVDAGPQGGGHRVAVGLGLGRRLVPIIGDVVARGALRQERRGRGQQDEGRQKQTVDLHGEPLLGAERGPSPPPRRGFAG